MASPLDEAIGPIEATSFFAQYAFCRDALDFMRAAQTSPSVRQLEDLLLGDPHQAEALVGRIERLLQAQSDRSVRNPFDHAIATYLYVLGEVNIVALKQALELVNESHLPNLWFARLVAASLAGKLPFSGESTVSTRREPSATGGKSVGYG